MFDSSFSSKTGASASVRFDGVMFSAVVIASDGKVTTLQDHDMVVLYKQVKEAANDNKTAMMAFRTLVRNMQHEIRMILKLKKAFVAFARPEFSKVRTAVKSKKVATKKVTAKKVVSKKKVAHSE